MFIKIFFWFNDIIDLLYYYFNNLYHQDINENKLRYTCVNCNYKILNDLFVVDDKYFCSYRCRKKYSQNNLII